jgi:hypothetical protein
MKTTITITIDVFHKPTDVVFRNPIEQYYGGKIDAAWIAMCANSSEAATSIGIGDSIQAAVADLLERLAGKYRA